MQGSAGIVDIDQCQKRHCSSHKCLCQAMQQLQAERTSQVIRSDGYGFVSHLTPTQQLAVARLVGMKCNLLCMLSGEVLWDTGTQVSIVSIAGLVRIYHH